MAELPRLQDFPFRDSQLLKSALTHRSAGNQHNERLEFLGDSVLNFVIAEALFQACPQATEGDLTRLRAHLVRGETLAALASDMGLGTVIKLGPGELKAGGHKRASILEDALEALIGAILCDAGFDEARRQVRALYADHLNHLPAVEDLKDPKTRLQEWLQERGLGLPSYELVAEQGPQHRKLFRAACMVEEHRCEAEGRSRRAAEQSAARKMMQNLRTDKSGAT